MRGKEIFASEGTWYTIEKMAPIFRLRIFQIRTFQVPMILLFMLALAGAANAQFDQSPPFRLIESGQTLSEDSIYLAPGRAYAFFNHNSKNFDLDTTTLHSTRRLLSLVKQQQIPSIMSAGSLKYEEHLSTYFLKPSETTYALQSLGGAHNFIFPGLRSMIFSGGFLEYCLCEAIRDVARGIRIADERLTFDLVTDAVFAKMQAAITYFDPKKYAAPQRYRSVVPLSTLLAQMSDNDIAAYFLNFVFNVKGDFLCPKQFTNSRHTEVDLKLSEFEFRLLMNGREIKRIGVGKKKINLNLLTTDELEKRLEREKKQNISVATPAESITVEKRIQSKQSGSKASKSAGSSAQH